MKFPFKKPRTLLGRIALYGSLSLLVLFAGGFFFLRSWLGSYLQSEDFRLWLGHITSKQLDARCEYEPFHFSGLTVNADGFKAQGTEKAAFSTLEIDKIHTGINLSGLWHKALEIDDVAIGRFQVSLGHTGAPPVPDGEIGIEPTQQKTPASPRNTWLAPKLDLRKVEVSDTNVTWGEKTPQEGAVTKTEVTAKPDGDAWNIVIKGGKVSQHGEPDFNLDHVNVHSQGPIIDLSEGLLKYPAGGDIGFTGEVNTKKSIEVDVKVNSVPVSPFLPPSMQARLHGNLFADIKVSGPMPVENSLQVAGEVHLENADIGDIPVLNVIGKILNSPELARIRLTTASANFAYAGGKVTVTNLIVEKKGLLCVKGHFVINDSRIDGHVDLGIPHDFLKIPVLESLIFTREADGYRWASDNFSGPLDSPTDDLMRRFEQLPNAVLGEAKDLLKQPSKVEDSGKQLLQGVFDKLHK